MYVGNKRRGEWKENVTKQLNVDRMPTNYT